MIKNRSVRKISRGSFLLSQSINDRSCTLPRSSQCCGWEKINDAARNDEQVQQSPRIYRAMCSGERNVPQPPKRKRDEEVGDNYPDMNEF